jgi:hypothetical protein
VVDVEDPFSHHHLHPPPYYRASLKIQLLKENIHLQEKEEGNIIAAVPMTHRGDSPAVASCSSSSSSSSESQSASEENDEVCKCILCIYNKYFNHFD